MSQPCVLVPPRDYKPTSNASGWCLSSPRDAACPLSPLKVSLLFSHRGSMLPSQQTKPSDVSFLTTPTSLPVQRV